MTKYMSLQEFKDLGFLQEVNRQWFHPHGLALDVLYNEGKVTGLGGIQDHRESGIAFDPKVMSQEKADTVREQKLKLQPALRKAFGKDIQSIGQEISTEE